MLRIQVVLGRDDTTVVAKRQRHAAGGAACLRVANLRCEHQWADRPDREKRRAFRLARHLGYAEDMA